MNYTRIKALFHAFQAFLIFLAWALTIAALTRPGGTDGRTSWFFALCFLSVPALIYLSAVPMWPRTQKFGNAYAFAVLDMLFGLLWFTAWIAVTSYVAGGKNDGEAKKENKDKKLTGCDAFAYGSPAKCRLSTGAAVLGVFIFLLFLGTSMLSLRVLREFRSSGTMPYDRHDPSHAVTSKDAFSTHPATHDLDDDDGDRDAEFRSGRPTDGHHDPGLAHHADDEEYTLLHQNDVDDLGNGRPPPSYDPTGYGHGNNGSASTRPGGVMHDYDDTSYSGGYGYNR